LPGTKSNSGINGENIIHICFNKDRVLPESATTPWSRAEAMNVKPHSFLTSALESKRGAQLVRGKVYFYQATENESLHSQNQLQEYDFNVQNFINRDGFYTVE
jgi:hypothetical protein